MQYNTLNYEYLRVFTVSASIRLTDNCAIRIRKLAVIVRPSHE